ncbi:hypothetical protein V5N34_38275, partial [Streptomyces baarnensis]
EPALLPPVPVEADRPKAELRPAGPDRAAEPVHAELPYGPQPSTEHGQQEAQPEHAQPHPQPQQQQPQPHQRQPLSLQKQDPPVPPTHDSPWFAAQKLPDNVHESTYDPQYAEGLEPTLVQIPAGHGRTRPLGDVGTIGAVPHPRQEELRKVAESVQEDAREESADSDQPASSESAQQSGVPPVTVTAQRSAPSAAETAVEEHQFTDHPVAGQLALEAESEAEQKEQPPEDERVRAAVELLRSDPSMSGAAIGRRLSIPERTARRVAKQAQAFIDEQARAKYGPLRPVPTQR